MSKAEDQNQRIQSATVRVVELEAELEIASEAKTGSADVESARAALHQWVDSVVAVVSSPGVGRVSLIHANGKESRISNPDLPYLLSRPVQFD